MLTMPADAVRARADRLIAALAAVPGLTCRLREGASTTGGGSAPASHIPTWLVALRHSDASSASIDRALRAGDPPVVTRMIEDEAALDLRTVDERDDPAIAQAIARAVQVGRS
jgi:L-seryl-tRNA(Ser) seleniumtransferase